MPKNLTADDRQRILIAGAYHMRLGKLANEPAWSVDKLVEVVHLELPDFTPRQLRAVYTELLVPAIEPLHQDLKS